MRKRAIVLGLFLASCLNAQDTLLFRDCLQFTKENSPRLKDRQLIDEEGALILQNLKSNWYPSLEINGKVSYQSDVVSIDIDQPGLMLTFPEMPNEQFGLNLDIRQTIYDGGYTKKKKQYEQLSTAVNLQSVEVDLYSLKEQVSNVYFTILALQENRKTLEIALENLKAREDVLESAVKNGIAEENDLWMIKVETLRLLQSISEIDAGRSGAMAMLRVYTGRELKENTMLELPFIEYSEPSEIVRPELQWFDLQSEVMDAGKDLSSVKRMPRFFAFGQAGLGMPGYNMLSDQVDTYYLIGAGLQWKIWDWNTTNRDKQILEKKKQMMLNSKETFSMNITAAMEKELQQTAHYKSSLELDDKMLGMRMAITKNASSKLDKGVISATDYLQILNEENRTRIHRSGNKIKLFKSIATYQLLKGTL